MNSHNPPHQLSNKLSVKCRAVAATFRLGVANFTRGTSPTMLVTSHIIPEILRMITYVLIARVIGGDAAQQYAIPGVIVLATTRMTISETSGLPVDDVWNKTLGSNVTGTLSPATQYLIRSLPLAAVAILDSAIVFIILGPMTTTDWATLTGAWLCSLIAVPTGLTLGLVISVASLRTDLHNLVHNATVSILTVCSGAIISVAHVPVFHAIGEFLPLTHAIRGLRLALAGHSMPHAQLTETLLEARNGLILLALAYLLYTVETARARRKGQTFFSS